jgi:hypothetical protein
MGGRDSVVDIANCYGLDGPGIESRWGTKFFAPVQTDSEAHPASYTMGTGSFPGVKRPGRGVGHPPPSSAAVIKKKCSAIPLPPPPPPLGLRGPFLSEIDLHSIMAGPSGRAV